MRYILLILFVNIFSMPLLAAPNEAISKPVKTVVQSVRYEKDDAALKHFASEDQGKFLLGDDWAKGSEAQRKEFTQRFNSLFAKIAFPKIRENFKNLASITYEDPKVEGDKARLKSTIVIDHPVKKQELKLEYTVVKVKGTWKVFDVSVLGDSMLTGIRDDQVRPIMKEGGWPKLLESMRQKDAELSKSK